MKALFVNFSISKISDLAKVPVRFSASHSYLTGVTTAELQQDMSNISMISMASCKKDVTPVRWQWSYVFLALTRQYING